MRKARRLTLTVQPGRYAIARFARGTELPVAYTESSFYSVTKTEDELSLVCEEKLLAPEMKAERSRRLIRVEGPLDFSLTGIVASLAGPLAEASISIFTIATYDTDYLLMIKALERAGHTVKRRPKE